MAHRFVREPLWAEEADRLANDCRSPEEKLIVRTLLDKPPSLGTLFLDPGQRPGAATLPPRHGRGRAPRLAAQATDRPALRAGRTILEPYFVLNDARFVGTRRAQKIVKRVADRAQFAREVTPDVLRHTWATLALQKGISLAAVQNTSATTA
jgi:integrase/recombinase XerD